MQKSIKQLTLSIPEPCHEGWNNMTPSEKGRFCGSCQKEVIDFTAMSDAELIAFFAQPNRGHVCGRAHVSQLNIPITKPVIHKKKKFWYVQYAATFLLLLTRPDGTKAQAKPPTTTVPPKPTTITMGMVLPQPPTKSLKGSIADEAGQPIANASVIIKGSRNGTVTDAEGNYQLRIKQNDVVFISAIGYESREIVFNGNDLSITTVLKATRTVLEGAVIVFGGTASDESTGYNTPRYKTLLQVKDRHTQTSLVNAAVNIVRNAGRKQVKGLTNNKGEYLLRRIRANENYTVTITAPGYQPQKHTINGYQLHRGINTATILLEKEPSAAMLDDVLVNAVKPTAKKTPLTDLLAGEIGCGILQRTAADSLPPLRPNQYTNAATTETFVQGRLGGITANIIAAKQPSAISVKRNGGILKRLFGKAAARPDASVNVYPNPAPTNSTVVIAFNKVHKGSYRLQLNGVAGSVVQQQTIVIPAENFNFQWELSNRVAAGSYIISISNAEGRILFSSKIIVVQ